MSRGVDVRDILSRETLCVVRAPVKVDHLLFLSEHPGLPLEILQVEPTLIQVSNNDGGPPRSSLQPLLGFAIHPTPTRTRNHGFAMVSVACDSDLQIGRISNEDTYHVNPSFRCPASSLLLSSRGAATYPSSQPENELIRTCIRCTSQPSI